MNGYKFTEMGMPTASQSLAIPLILSVKVNDVP
jgi:hypothetical protein